MYLELAKQWLKSNGYSTDLSLYHIRKAGKNLPVYSGKLLHKTSSFEIYFLAEKRIPKEAKPVSYIPKKK